MYITGGNTTKGWDIIGRSFHHFFISIYFAWIAEELKKKITTETSLIYSR